MTRLAIIAPHFPEYALQYARAMSNHRDVLVCLDEADGTIFCLVEAPSADAASTVHREAHGLVADQVHLVKEGS